MPNSPTEIDHIGIAVRDLEAAVEEYRAAFGLEPVHRERVEDQGVDEALFAVGSSYIQLLAATGPDTPVGRFLVRRGEGIHHVGYRVPEVAAVLDSLRGAVLPTAHDVVREHRVLSALAATPVRAPRPVLLCEDPDVIGAPFYLMERVDGLVIRDRLPAALSDDVSPAVLAARRDLGH